MIRVECFRCEEILVLNEANKCEQCGEYYCLDCISEECEEVCKICWDIWKDHL